MRESRPSEQILGILSIIPAGHLSRVAITLVREDAVPYCAADPHPERRTMYAVRRIAASLCELRIWHLIEARCCVAVLGLSRRPLQYLGRSTTQRTMAIDFGSVKGCKPEYGISNSYVRQVKSLELELLTSTVFIAR